MCICERGLNNEKVDGMKPIISYMKLEQHHLLGINDFSINTLTNKAPIIHDNPST